MHTRLALTILLVAQLGDALTFTIGEALHGIGLESNGIVRLAYDDGGLAGVLFLKCATIVLVLTALAFSARRWPRFFMALAAAGTLVGLVGVVTNVWSLVLLTR
jgi:hypothetical protein